MKRTRKAFIFLQVCAFCFFIVMFSGSAFAQVSLNKEIDFYPGGDTNPIRILNSGDEIQYTIDYTFTVPMDNTTVTITDVFDSNLTLVTRTNDSNFNQSLFGGNTLTWQKTSTFNQGTYSGALTFRTTIDNGLVAGTDVVNNVCLNMDLPGSNQDPQEVCDTVTFTIGQRPPSIPTMTQWGMIVFMVLAGLGSVYYQRRKKRVER
jgi:hypothetical protein